MVKGGKVLVITLCHFKSMFNAIVITDCTTVDKCNTCCDQLIFSVCYYLDISKQDITLWSQLFYFLSLTTVGGERACHSPHVSCFLQEYSLWNEKIAEYSSYCSTLSICWHCFILGRLLMETLHSLQILVRGGTWFCGRWLLYQSKNVRRATEIPKDQPKSFLIKYQK